MEKTVYFKICYNIEEYKKIERTKREMFKRTEINIKNKILEILNNFKFYIFCKYNYMKKIKKNNIKMYVIFIKNIKDIEKNRIINKIMNKINKKIDKLYIEDKSINIILSKEIKCIANNKNEKNISEFSNIKNILILSEKNKKIYNEYINEIINNIILMEGKKIEEQTIYILLNSNNIKYKKWINSIIDNYKIINIVTKNIKQFKKYEKEAENRFDAISILNNKRKSLTKAKYIINVDFNNEEILRVLYK